MPYTLLVLVSAALCAVAAVLPAGAHHSRSNFDLNTLVDLEGAVNQVHWLFPHTWIYSGGASTAPNAR